MTVRKICIFTQSPLSRAPRVVKEANVYAKAGYQVTVYGLWYDKDLLKKDHGLLHPEVCYKAGIDLLAWNSLGVRKIRTQRALQRNLVKWLGWESIGALGYNFRSYLKRLKGEKADLYIGHEEMSMALAEQLIKYGEKVAFDFEDWHSRDLLPKDRRYRPLKLLQRLEEYLLKNAYCAYTTSLAMAEAMANTYHTKTPKIIYNSFPAIERTFIENTYIDRKDLEIPSVYWFSQVISEGRGIELLLEALKEVRTVCQLHLRGEVKDSYREFLEDNVPDYVNLFIHETVTYRDLISRIAEHDLGIAFEENFPENKDLTISNKIFHYLQSGIAILATHTAGQQEVADRASGAICVVENDPKKIASAIDRILSNPQHLAKMKQASWDAGSTDFAFENESDKLKTFIDR